MIPPRKASLIGAGILLALLAGLLFIPRSKPPEKKAVPSSPVQPMIPSRFNGTLAFVANPSQVADASTWVAGEVARRPAWLDKKSGLVWGPKLAPEYTAWSEGFWQEAVQTCLQQEPKGRWALPTLGEFVKSKNHGLLQTLPDMMRCPRWYASNFVQSHGSEQEMMSFFGVKPSSELKGVVHYGVRCVGQAEGTPQG